MSERVQLGVKVARETVEKVDLISSALGVDKGVIIDNAVATFITDRLPALTKYLDASMRRVEAAARPTPASPEEPATQKPLEEPSV